MPLTAGTRLGPYEIVAAIGAGGMGEVYKARDTRLDRTVAVKVLPSHWADNVEMKQRFDREAQTIASLNHPHICALHDVGTASVQGDGSRFLVMEFLDGETLAERLKRGAMPIDEALTVAIAIADALDKAHRQGVVHRDLKPSNVMLTPTGAKLLDFGLAKYAAPAVTSGPRDGVSPVRATPATPATPLTGVGTILGTLQYMAPEQLDGHDADARTDIFAFGALLHEMVTGAKAFEGRSQVLLISAIATSDPQPPSRIQPAVPAALDHVVKTCLAKDPHDRWRDARDLLAELQWIAEGGADAGLTEAAAGGGRSTRERIARALLVAAVVVIAALATPTVLYVRGPREPEEFRFRAVFSPAVTGSLQRGAFAVSPNGRAIAFRALVPNTGGGVAQNTYALYVGAVGSVTSQRLAGTEDAAQPFWSSDSRSIAFVAGVKLRKIDASGGSPQDICDAPDFFGGAWNSEGTIVLGSAQGLFRVPAQGGKPVALTTLDPSETGHFWPRFLPDGRHYLYLAWSGEATTRAVIAGTLDSKVKTRVMAAESNVAYAEPGYLLFHRERTVYAQVFNAKTLALSGEPVRVADEVVNTASGRGHFDVSRDGVLVYYYNIVTVPNDFLEAREWQLRWAERGGKELDTVGPYGVYRGVEVSPDGTRVAVHRHEGTGGDVWVMEPPPRNPTRITFDASHDNSSPVWSPDGSRIVFASQRNTKWGLYQTRADGSGGEELLVESELPKAPMSWSPDGKRLVYWVQDPKTAGDLWVLPLDGDKKPVPFIATAFNETHAQVSPDGKWIAYASNRTGRDEIFVQPFPSGSGLWQISPPANAGGDWPRWRRDGKELFYRSLGSGVGTGTTTPYPRGTGTTGPIFSAPVSINGAAFEAGSPKEVVRVNALDFPHSGGDYHTYGVSSDGQRFLVFQLVSAPAAAAATPTQIGPDQTGFAVALHWSAAMKK